jgi:hypothetical protein
LLTEIDELYESMTKTKIWSKVLALTQAREIAEKIKALRVRLRYEMDTFNASTRIFCRFLCLIDPFGSLRPTLIRTTNSTILMRNLNKSWRIVTEV